MLPVVTSVRNTKKQILLYTLLLVTLTLVFFSTRTVGWIYLGSAITLGFLMVYLAWRLVRLPGVKGARNMYLYSLLYLAALFAAMALDSVLDL